MNQIDFCCLLFKTEQLGNLAKKGLYFGIWVFYDIHVREIILFFWGLECDNYSRVESIQGRKL